MPSNRQECDATKSKNGLFEPTGKEANARLCTTCNLEELDDVEDDVPTCVEVEVEVVSRQQSLSGWLVVCSRCGIGS